MQPERKTNFFSKNENRLFATLLLAIGYPIVCAAFFPIFVFLILPITPLFSMAGLCLYAYWLVSAGAWLLALGIVLPQMRSDIPVERPVFRDPESTFDLKRVTLRGSCDVLDDTKEDASRRSSRSKNEGEKIQKDEHVESHSQLLNGSSQPQIHCSKDDLEVSAEPSSEKTLEEHKAFEVDLEGHEQGSSLHESLVDDVVEEVAATKITTTPKYIETSMSTTTTVRETYECSLPSPEPTSGDGHAKNTVFIFVNSENDQMTKKH